MSRIHTARITCWFTFSCFLRVKSQFGARIDCREPLLRENPKAAEAMDMEQTWPTQEEMQGGDENRHRRLAPGTSDYQACWILDDDDEATDEALDDEDDDPPDIIPGGVRLVL